MLDKERILRRLLDLERYSSRMEEIVPRSKKEYINGGFELKAAVERHLQLISDIEIEVLLLVYKGKEMSLLGEENSLLNRIEEIIGQKVTIGVRSRRTLRNTLVHAYSDVSYDEEVHRQANDLTDLREFIRSVRRVIKKSSSR